MVSSIDKKLLALARTDSRLQTPEVLKHQITSAIERACTAGERHSLVAVMRAVDPARRDKFCQHLLARFVAAIPAPVPGERVAPRFKEPARFLAAARAEADAADETEYVSIRGLFDPEWPIHPSGSQPTTLGARRSG
jgi:hypothetical protein